MKQEIEHNVHVISLNDISEDILSQIFKRLPCKLAVVCPVAGVSKSWRKTVLEDKDLLRSVELKIDPCNPIRSQQRCVPPSRPCRSVTPILTPHILFAVASSGNVQGICAMAKFLTVHSANPECSLKWWKAAARAGVAEGQYEYGKAFYQGRDSVPQDGEEALIWLGRAARNPDCSRKILASASTILGYLHLDGEGTKCDNITACKWFTIAKDNGSIEAEKTLGWMYNTGQFG